MKQGREEGIEDSKNCVLLAGHVLMRVNADWQQIMRRGRIACRK